jgi:hypothetical protein
MAFWKQIRTWGKNVVQKLKELWSVWFLLLLGNHIWGFSKDLILDRDTGSVNTWLDNYAPELAKFIRENMSLLPHSELDVMAWLFFLIISGIMIFICYDTRSVCGETAFVPLSPQDKVNIEKLTVLFRACAKPASDDLQQIGRQMCQHMVRSAPETKDQKGVFLFILFNNCILSPCNQAGVTMSIVLEDSNKENLQVLQQCFAKFFCAYQLLVRWAYRLTKLFPPIISEYSEYRLEARGLKARGLKTQGLMERPGRNTLIVI